MTQNPLTLPVAAILRQQTAALSEYELLQALQLSSEAFLDAAEGDSDLALFRQHFLIMNALYSLQPLFLEEGWLLEISALKIELLPAKASDGLPAMPGEDAIRAYYLDWSEFENSSSQSVQALLDSFWQRYHAEDETAQALSDLGLENGADWQSIKQAYRRLAALHHPDRGGDEKHFIRIREAYETLACLNT
ncbi:DNA-J related domain-containing protein [Neptuniibacter halophilus]|uniref:DNA-J related domain-containing protein n=1 Tax=Neptuniibacter halophilus TaxID=651666 RepID=UPI0025746B07|nr:DNA-J related domain-containing protein [Neptuniibacter halophilus]